MCVCVCLGGGTGRSLGEEAEGEKFVQMERMGVCRRMRMRGRGERSVAWVM